MYQYVRINHYVYKYSIYVEVSWVMGVLQIIQVIRPWLSIEAHGFGDHLLTI